MLRHALFVTVTWLLYLNG